MDSSVFSPSVKYSFPSEYRALSAASIPLTSVTAMEAGKISPAFSGSPPRETLFSSLEPQWQESAVSAIAGACAFAISRVTSAVSGL